MLGEIKPSKMFYWMLDTFAYVRQLINAFGGKWRNLADKKRELHRFDFEVERDLRVSLSPLISTVSSLHPLWSSAACSLRLLVMRRRSLTIRPRSRNQTTDLSIDLICTRETWRVLKKSVKNVILFTQFFLILFNLKPSFKKCTYPRYDDLWLSLIKPGILTSGLWSPVQIWFLKKKIANHSWIEGAIGNTKGLIDPAGVKTI